MCKCDNKIALEK